MKDMTRLKCYVRSSPESRHGSGNAGREYRRIPISFSLGGLFGFNSNFLRVIQDHRSRLNKLYSFDRPPGPPDEYSTMSHL
jgi:hypothetical protein